MVWKMRKEDPKKQSKTWPNNFRPLSGRLESEVQTVNSEGGGEGAVERSVKSNLKKAQKPWIRGKKGAQNRELGRG